MMCRSFSVHLVNQSMLQVSKDVTVVCMWWYTSKATGDDVCYLSQNVGAVPMEGVDFSIEGVDMSASLHRAGSWTVLFCTLPLATLAHAVST